MRVSTYKHQVVKCQEWEPKKFRPGTVSPKYDGIRGFFYPDEKLLWTRNEKPLYGFDHIVDEFRRRKYDHVSDMELYIPGIEFNELSGLIRDHNALPQALAMVIDAPSVKSYLPERLAARPEDTDGSPLIRIPHYKVSTVNHVLHYYKRSLAEELEGIVYKTLDHYYVDGRPWDWMRWVPVKSQDCEVISFYEGKGKMAGMVGGMYVNWWNPVKNAFELAKVGTMRGIDYEARVTMWWNQEEYTGRIAQINFKGYQPSGQPRQPRFYAWRDDK